MDTTQVFCITAPCTIGNGGFNPPKSIANLKEAKTQIGKTANWKFKNDYSEKICILQPNIPSDTAVRADMSAYPCKEYKTYSFKKGDVIIGFKPIKGDVVSWESPEKKYLLIDSSKLEETTEPISKQTATNPSTSQPPLFSYHYGNKTIAVTGKQLFIVAVLAIGSVYASYKLGLIKK